MSAKPLSRNNESLKLGVFTLSTKAPTLKTNISKSKRYINLDLKPIDFTYAINCIAFSSKIYYDNSSF